MWFLVYSGGFVFLFGPKEGQTFFCETLWPKIETVASAIQKLKIEHFWGTTPNKGVQDPIQTETRPTK